MKVFRIIESISCESISITQTYDELEDDLFDFENTVICRLSPTMHLIIEYVS